MNIKKKDNSLVILLFIFSSLLLSLNINPEKQLISSVIILLVQATIFLIILPFIKVQISEKNMLLLFLWFSLFIFSLLSSQWSTMPFEVFQRTLLAFVPTLFLLLLIYSDSKPLKTFLKVSIGLMVTGFTLSLIGIFIYLFGEVNFYDNNYIQTLNIGPINLSQIVISTNTNYRISSLTGNPNNLGMLLIFTISSTIILLKTNYFKKSLTGTIILLIQIVALILTFSRASIISFILFLLILILLTSITFKQLFNRSVIILIILSISYLVFILVQNLGYFTRSSYLAGREVAWQLTLDSLSENPYLGVGFGVANENILQFAGVDISTHNTHLSLLSEIGLIGYVLFLAFWMLPIFFMLKNREEIIRKTHYNIIFNTLIALMITLFFHQMFETKIPYYGVYSLLWIYFLALVFHPKLISSKKL